MTRTQRYAIKMVWMVSVIMQGVMQGVQVTTESAKRVMKQSFISGITVCPRIPSAALGEVGFSSQCHIIIISFTVVRFV